MAVNLTGNNTTDAATIKSQYPGYTGWNDVNSIVADYKATGGAGKGGAVTTNSTPQATTAGGISAPSFNDVINNAKQAQQFQIQANQPAIQTIQAGTTDLGNRYNDLINSIKGVGSVAVNAQTQALNAGFAARGLAPGEYTQTQMAAGLRPVTSQIENTIAGAGLQENQDLLSAAAQIASLQAGNVLGALQTSSGIAALQNAISQIQQQQQYIPIPGIGVYNTALGSLVGGYSTSAYNILNPTTGNSIIGGY